MTKVRQLSKRNPLYIEKHAFWSAYHFALQYPDWKRQYAEAMAQTIKAVDYNDMPHASTTGDPTPRIAMRTSILRANIELIEHTALTAGQDLAEYLLYAVTNEGVTFVSLSSERCPLGRIPCERTKYYQMRRLFYYLLSKRLEERGITD